ncbi:MAG: outer membrane beta-barrel family protein [Sphingomicrobium sp.]
MFADQPPAIVQPSETDEQTGVIEVVGTRRDQAQKIDRRTYRVKDNPHSAQADSLQLLRGLPAVTVTPDDQIFLLGSGNVTMYVDGRPYQGKASQYLRTLHGSDIARIEVITNPSAQYSAQGTGGIINFVLRKKQGDGLSGNASAQLSMGGRGEVDSTVKSKHGRWTYELQAGGGAGRFGSRSTYHKRRSVEATPGGPATINTEDGGGFYRGTDGHLSGKITYDLDSRTSVSAKLAAGGGHDRSVNNAKFRGLTPDFASFSERQRLNSIADFVITEFNFDHKGIKEGETLTAAAQFYGNPKVRDVTSAEFSDGGSLSIAQHNRTLFGHTQLDWNHPMGKGQILSLGGSWDLAWWAQHYRFTSVGGDGSLGPNSVDEYSALNNTLAAYGTFQQPVGSWTVMPGIRLERNSRHIASRGLPDVRADHTNLFPTLHVQHALSKTLDLTLSYSKRIDRASVQNLRPYRSVENVVTIFQGNPGLKDQSIDAYEVNLHYRRGKIDAGVIVYDRETSRLWTKSYTVNPAGVSVYTIVNAGHRRDSGAQIDLSTPIVRRVKANVSVNLFNQRGPIETDGGRETRETFRYTTNGTIEWDGPDRGKTPGDVAQLQWTYYGPQRDFQFRNFAWDQFTASYTHSFSRTVSLSATFDYHGPNRHRLIAPLVQEYYAEHRRPEFKLKLLKTLGNP